MQLVIRRADTGAVIASSGEMTSPEDNDVLLQCMLSEARLTSLVREYDVSVTRLLGFHSPAVRRAQNELARFDVRDEPRGWEAARGVLDKAVRRAERRLGLPWAEPLA
jgi:hypothetical protein